MQVDGGTGDRDSRFLILCLPFANVFLGHPLFCSASNSCMACGGSITYRQHANSGIGCFACFACFAFFIEILTFFRQRRKFIFLVHFVEGKWTFKGSCCRENRLFKKNGPTKIPETPVFLDVYGF